MKDSEYPEWLWTLGEKPLTLAQLRKIGYEKMTDEQKKRFFKVQNRAVVKDFNVEHAKM